MSSRLLSSTRDKLSFGLDIGALFTKATLIVLNRQGSVRMHEDIKPKIRALELDNTYGKFAIEPLEPGFGHTLGNAFRRTLLAHIRGAAITEVRIQGALHEFETLAGVVEDTTEIMLNIREIIVQLDEEVTTDEDVVMKIEVNGPGKVYAADVKAPAGVQIINPQLYIAEVTDDDTELNIEMWVQGGVGYQLAEERKRGQRAVDVLPIDAVFSPIHRANYYVEPTRLGSRTDLDRMVIEVWGDGSVSPEEALRMAAEELWSYISIFLGVTGELAEEEEVPEEELVATKNHEIAIEDVDFSVRTFNCLKKENINTLGEVVQRTSEELLAIRNFGKRSMEEVIEKLGQYDLYLAEHGDKDEE